MQLIGKLLRLSGQERYWLALAVMGLPVTKLALRVFGFTRVGGMIARLPGARRQPGRATPGAAAGMVGAAAARPGLRANCLERSLTLQWLLKLHGVESSLCIGVRHDADQLAAHAWLEAGDRVLNDRANVAEDYTPVSEQFDRWLKQADVR